MNETSIARRYARALNEEAAQQNLTTKIDEDMALVADTFEGSPELVRVFESPVVPREKKKAVVKSLFADRIQPLTLHFVDLLIDKKREGLFPTVVRAYRELRDHEQGVVEATARVATELSSEDTDAMKKRLEDLTGSKVRLEVRKDASILGGAIVRIGDTVYDGSIRNKLGALRARMQQGSFN
jgi:F-type H+-transporting ATPase subunit delta